MTSLASVWKVQGLQDSLQKIEHFFPANVYVLFQVCFCLHTWALERFSPIRPRAWADSPPVARAVHRSADNARQ